MSMENLKKEYLQEHEALMKKWAKEAEEWTGIKATFYADGVFAPECWFEEGNEFRPLFVLKEVYEKVEESDAQVNFVGTGKNGSDPWKGEGTWKRLGVLATAVLQMSEDPKTIPDYENLKKKMHEKNQTENTLHQRTCRRSALINLKKLAGGATADSSKSKNTLCFKCHAKRFSENLRKQIELIDPTVIICCGVGVAQSLGVKDGKIYGIDAVDGSHPRRSSTENFYYRTLEEMQRRNLFKSSK